MKKFLSFFRLRRDAAIPQPGFRKPKNGPHWLERANWGERVGLNEPTAEFLRWVIEKDLIPEEEISLAVSRLFSASHKSQLFEFCEYAASLRGKTAAEFVEGTNNFTLLSDLVVGPYRENVRKRLVRGIESEAEASFFLLAVHNFLVSGAETLPMANGDSFWAINELLSESAVKLSKQNSSGANSAYNLKFDFHTGQLPAKLPKVTVIMPCYNAEDTVAHAINAVLSQSYENFELLVVDDGSTDRSRDIVKSVETQDSRIRLIALAANQGAYVARNVGLEEATGEFVLVVDADDIPFPNLLETHITAISENKDLIAVVSRALRITPELQILNLNFRNFSSLTFRRQDVLAQIGFWDQSVRVSADAEFLFRIQAHFGEHRVSEIDQKFALYVAQDQSLTRRGEFDLFSSQRSAGGFRNVYRSQYKKWHSSGQELYCQRDIGIGLMSDHFTTFSPPSSVPRANFIIHLGRYNIKVHKRLKRVIENRGSIVVANSTCLFSIEENLAKEYQDLLDKGELRLATLDYMRKQSKVVREKCGGRQYLGLNHARICGCENRISSNR